MCIARSSSRDNRVLAIQARVLSEALKLVVCKDYIPGKRMGKVMIIIKILILLSPRFCSLNPLKWNTQYSRGAWALMGPSWEIPPL